MKKYIIIILGKLSILIGKILHKNMSVIPGTIALKIDENALSYFEAPKLVIAVTGSSGKGTVSNMIYHILKSKKYNVIYNHKGSNLRTAIITLLLENCSLNGKVKKDAMVIEIDERYTKLVFPYIKPTYLVITNITRDQPPRQGHFDLVLDDIKKSLTKEINLVLNADDPYLQKLNIGNKFNITYYSLNKNKYSYTKNKFENLNLVYCPKCHSKLEYNFYHIENIGNYHCSKCNFKTPDSDYLITNIDYKNYQITINNKVMKIPSNILYSVYNTAAAFTTASILGINEKEIADIISLENEKNNGIDIYECKNKLVTVLNNKNENSTTFNQSLLYIERFKEEKTIIIGWKEISRRYKHDDLSWLYDIDFELLKKCNVKKIICVGINRYDIATRIKYSNIKLSPIVFDNLEDTTNYLKNKNKNNIYAILNFDYVKPFNDLMKEGK